RRWKPAAAICRVAVLIAGIACVSACAELPLASRPGPVGPNDTDNAATFRDLLSGRGAATSDAPQRAAAARRQPVRTDKEEGGEARIYEGASDSGQPIRTGGAASQLDGAAAGIVPTAYRVADAGVTPLEGDKFQVTFENADIAVVARAILGDSLRLNYSVDPRVRGSISLSAQRPVSRSQLLWMLENALRAQGAILVRQEGDYRVLPASEAEGVGGTNIGPDAGTPGFGITALPLQNISADALTKILVGFGASADAVRVDPSRNLVIVRGTTSERQWMIDTALAFDVDWMRSQSVGILPVKDSSPEVVINEISQMAGAVAVRLQPIARLNAILAVARSPESIRQVQTWVTRLDRRSDFGPRVHVYRLKSADARKVVAVLRDVFGSSGNTTMASEQTSPAGAV